MARESRRWDETVTPAIGLLIGEMMEALSPRKSRFQSAWEIFSIGFEPDEGKLSVGFLRRHYIWHEITEAEGKFIDVLVYPLTPTQAAILGVNHPGLVTWATLEEAREVIQRMKVLLSPEPEGAIE